MCNSPPNLIRVRCRQQPEIKTSLRLRRLHVHRKPLHKSTSFIPKPCSIKSKPTQTKQSQTHIIRNNASLKINRIHRHNLRVQRFPSLNHRKLALPKPTHNLHTLHQILHRISIVHPRPVPGRSLRPDLHVPRNPIRVENPKFVAGRGLPLVEREANVEPEELIGLDELGGPVQAAYLFLGDEGDVDGAQRGEGAGLEVADGLEVLDGDAFVVLSAASEHFAVGGAVGGEGRVEPLGGLGGDGVEVGVEEDRGEGGV